ncbi:hypothetical protein RhiirB3_435263 [Rhizophagus irregularis]|nr:hypothetical protein RhiirB3_435263 [Rhizophagus irregularis]
MQQITVQPAATAANIILRPHEGGIQRISEIHHPYTPLYYVLMFPRGEDGTYSSPAL